MESWKRNTVTDRIMSLLDLSREHHYHMTSYIRNEASMNADIPAGYDGNVVKSNLSQCGYARSTVTETAWLH